MARQTITLNGVSVEKTSSRIAYIDPEPNIAINSSLSQGTAFLILIRIDDSSNIFSIHMDSGGQLSSLFENQGTVTFTLSTGQSLSFNTDGEDTSPAYNWNVDSTQIDSVYNALPASGTISGTLVLDDGNPVVDGFTVTADMQRFQLFARTIGNVTKWQYKVATTSAGISSASWTDVPDSASEVLNFETADIGWGATRYFQVRAVLGTINGDVSATKSASTIVQPTAPSKPTSFTATLDDLRVTLQANTDDNRSDIIKWQFKEAASTSALTSAPWVDIAGHADDTSLDFTTNVLGVNVTRYFRVRAVNAFGNSPQSDVRSVTTGTGNVPPQPTEFAVTVEGRRFLLTGNESESDLHIIRWEYKVATTAGGLGSAPWQEISGHAFERVLHWNSAEFPYSTTRHFQVRAVNNAGNGPASASKSGTTVAEPQPSGLIEVKATDGSNTSLFYVPYTTADGDFPDVPFWSSGLGTRASPRVYDHRLFRDFLAINQSFLSSSFSFNGDTCWVSLRTRFTSTGKWYIDLTGTGVSAKVYQGNTFQASISNSARQTLSVSADTDYDIVIISSSEPSSDVTMLQTFSPNLPTGTETGAISENPQGLRKDITGISANTTLNTYYMTVEYDTDEDFSNPQKLYDVHLDQYHFVSYSQPQNTTYYRARFTRSSNDGGNKGPWSATLTSTVSETTDSTGNCGTRPAVDVCNPIWLGYPDCVYQEGERPEAPDNLCNPTWQGFPTCAWVAAARPAAPSAMCVPTWHDAPICAWQEGFIPAMPTCPEGTINDSVWVGSPTCAWTQICTSTDPCHPRDENPGNICNAEYDVNTCAWVEGDRPVAPSNLCNAMWQGHPTCAWTEGDPPDNITYCNPECVNGSWQEGDPPPAPTCGACEAPVWQPYPICEWECQFHNTGLDCWGHQVR